MRRCYYEVHYIWVYGGTICLRRRCESRGFYTLTESCETRSVEVCFIHSELEQVPAILMQLEPPVRDLRLDIAKDAPSDFDRAPHRAVLEVDAQARVLSLRVC